MLMCGCFGSGNGDPYFGKNTFAVSPLENPALDTFTRTMMNRLDELATPLTKQNPVSLILGNPQAAQLMRWQF